MRVGGDSWSVGEGAREESDTWFIGGGEEFLDEVFGDVAGACYGDALGGLHFGCVGVREKSSIIDNSLCGLLVLTFWCFVEPYICLSSGAKTRRDLKPGWL